MSHEASTPKEEIQLCADPYCGLRPISEFRRNKDGVISDLCKKRNERHRKREWRIKHLERSREINRKSQSKPEYKAKRAQYQRDRIKTQSFRARRKLWQAIQSGKVQKPEHCELCNRTDISGHHTDYSRPLDVTWLCHYHHGLYSRLDAQDQNIAEVAA